MWCSLHSCTFYWSKWIYIEEHFLCEDIWMVEFSHYPLLGLLDYVGLWDFTKEWNLLSWEGVLSKGLVWYNVMNFITWYIVMILCWSCYAFMILKWCHSRLFVLILILSMLTLICDCISLMLIVDFFLVMICL